MKEFKLRIGNIELRAIDSKHYNYEVMKWSPNSLYGKKDEYRVETPLGEVTYEHNGVKYSESCFEHPESCYVVSFIKYDWHEGWWEVEEVATRPWELPEKDYDDWTKVMKTCLVTKILPEPIEEDEKD